MNREQLVTVFSIQELYQRKPAGPRFIINKRKKKTLTQCRGNQQDCLLRVVMGPEVYECSEMSKSMAGIYVKGA